MKQQGSGARGQRSGTTWADIFWIWKFKGADPAYAAHMADKWEKRQERKHAKAEREKHREVSSEQ